MCPILLSANISGQIFPIQVVSQLVPPYSPYLSAYTAPGAQNLMVQIHPNDVSLSNYPCKLRITIAGVGITLITKAASVTRPLMLQGGVPQILYGEDLIDYFHPGALDFYGMSKREYETTGRLPEGVYRFSVEVLDYNRGTVVSNTGVAIAWIILNDPPILNFPSHLARVKIQGTTNILFTWTPRHSGSPNAAFTTEYTFRLVEIWPDNRNPNDALLTQLPLFEATTTQNQFLYGMTEPALIPGRKYAWQVQSKDVGGKDLFRNDGRSEVFVFQYGATLAVPDNFHLQWAKPTTLSMRWDPVVVEGEEVRYRLQYRARQRREDQQWYETTTQFTEKTLYHLQSNTDYEMRIRTELAAQESEYSDIRVFKTLPPEKDGFVCLDPITPPPPPANTLPVFPLRTNDTLRAGGYDILVRNVMEVEGKYHGFGIAIVPWLNAAKVRVTFENIRVNHRYWLTSGIIKSVWNPESGFLLEEETPILPGMAPQAGELDITILAADTLITIDGMAIATVTKDDGGNVVVTTTDGKQQVLPMGETYAIVDEVGNGYVVDGQGNIVKTTASEAKAVAARGARQYNLALRFERGDGQYGFDVKTYDGLAHYYQQLEGGSYVPWKALSTAQPDNIEARLVSNEVDIREVTFEVSSTPVTSLSSNEGSANLTLSGKMAGLEEELLALHRVSDTLPAKVIGKLNLATYAPVHYNLEIVPVNGASLPADLDDPAISKGLNTIYNDAVVAWRVHTEKNIQLDLPAAFDDGETGVFSNYTEDMQTVLKAFGRLDDNTYYLFIIGEPRNPASLGYMPRNRQAGFVFADPHKGNAEQFLKTIAHELGHGAFNLKHTFSEHNFTPGATDNVMDYGPGTALYKYQWDYIHDPQSVAGLFEGDEAGESVVVRTLLERFEIVKPLFEDEKYKGWFQKFRKVNEFFQSCHNDKWESYSGQGIIPWCFWKNSELQSDYYFTTIDLPFVSGIVDGGYIEAEGLYRLPEVIRDIREAPGKMIYAYTMAYWDCRTEKLISSYEEYEYVIRRLAEYEEKDGIWNWVQMQWTNYEGVKEDLETYFNDCRDAEDLYETIEDLYELISNWEEVVALSEDVGKRLDEYLSVLESTQNTGRYEIGKVIIPAASLILPFGAGMASKVAKLKSALNILKGSPAAQWKKFGDQVKALITMRTLSAINLSPDLKTIYDKCVRAGYKASDKGQDIIFYTIDHTEVAKISKDVLHIRIPNHHGFWAPQSKTSESIEALAKANNGAPLYRIGTLSRSSGAEGQYWSLENPLLVKDVETFARKYGIPEENLTSGDLFVEIGRPKQNVPRIARETPGFKANPGGSIEIVVPKGGITLEGFHTIKF